MDREEIATIAAEAHAHLSEEYREALGRFPGYQNTFKRYVLREQMAYHAGRCAEIMAQLPTQAVRP